MTIRFPYKKFELQSNLSPKDALHKLLTHIEPMDKVPVMAAEPKWFGRINDNSFMVRKYVKTSRGYGYSVTIKGIIIPTSQGSNVIVQICPTIWGALGLLIACIVYLRTAFTSPEKAPSIILPIIALGVIVFFVGGDFRNGALEAEQFLNETLSTDEIKS